MNWLAIVAIGGTVGFLAGLFGAGGSAVGTPLLHAAGVPAFVAVASPLPCAIPVALAASGAYWGKGLIERRIITLASAFAVPATIAGALLTPLVGGLALVHATEVIVVVIGLRLALFPMNPVRDAAQARGDRIRLAILATVIGLLSGLLANSGGFLLTPLFLLGLHMPITRALATSLAMSALLAVPGTITHAALGHIDWLVVAAYGLPAIPTAHLGARVALRSNPAWLGRAYGISLALLGTGLLAF